MNEIIQKINEMIPGLRRDSEKESYILNPKATALLKALHQDLIDILPILNLEMTQRYYEDIVCILSSNITAIELARQSMNPVEKTFMGNYRHQVNVILRGIVRAWRDREENGL
jgi:hypothetical protein